MQENLNIIEENVDKLGGDISNSRMILNTEPISYERRRMKKSDIHQCSNDLNTTSNGHSYYNLSENSKNLTLPNASNHARKFYDSSPSVDLRSTNRFGGDFDMLNEPRGCGGVQDIDDDISRISYYRTNNINN